MQWERARQLRASSASLRDQTVVSTPSHAPLERMGYVCHPRRMLRMCIRHGTPAGIVMLQWWPSVVTGATWPRDCWPPHPPTA